MANFSRCAVKPTRSVAREDPRWRVPFAPRDVPRGVAGGGGGGGGGGVRVRVGVEKVGETAGGGGGRGRGWVFCAQPRPDLAALLLGLGGVLARGRGEEGSAAEIREGGLAVGGDADGDALAHARGAHAGGGRGRGRRADGLSSTPPGRALGPVGSAASAGAAAASAGRAAAAPASARRRARAARADASRGARSRGAPPRAVRSASRCRSVPTSPPAATARRDESARHGAADARAIGAAALGAVRSDHGANVAIAPRPWGVARRPSVQTTTHRPLFKQRRVPTRHSPRRTLHRTLSHTRPPLGAV